MCKTISPFFYYSELKRYERKKVLSDTNKNLSLIPPSLKFNKEAFNELCS